MVTLNFREFRIPTGISRREFQVIDAREGIANLLYMNAGGIKAHHLAFKIYESQGSEDYSEDEVRLVSEFVERVGLGYIIDGLKEQVENQPKKA